MLTADAMGTGAVWKRTARVHELSEICILRRQSCGVGDLLAAGPVGALSALGGLAPAIALALLCCSCLERSYSSST